MSKYGDSNKYGSNYGKENSSAFKSTSQTSFGQDKYRSASSNPFTSSMTKDKYTSSTNTYAKSNQCLFDSNRSKSYGWSSQSSRYDAEKKKSDTNVPYQRFDVCNYSSQPSKRENEKSSGSNVPYERLNVEKSSSKFSNWFKRK